MNDRLLIAAICTLPIAGAVIGIVLGTAMPSATADLPAAPVRAPEAIKAPVAAEEAPAVTGRPARQQVEKTPVEAKAEAPEVEWYVYPPDYEPPPIPDHIWERINADPRLTPERAAELEDARSRLAGQELLYQAARRQEADEDAWRRQKARDDWQYRRYLYWKRTGVWLPDYPPQPTEGP